MADVTILHSRKAGRVAIFRLEGNERIAEILKDEELAVLQVRAYFPPEGTRTVVALLRSFGMEVDLRQPEGS